ncbi:glyoxalase/bleomycin resistance/extradiol dioxygenase family protein [Planotetraspora phitsanulokensis]|uniref:Glyoxalase/fosfomycin resistance/dioxygenase domain-containing protein n=1 Tax=Planotetraspora phitsanulokensis TaxID=575192 RepID=A0A8J3UBI9_9ACTN|nr:VOC family protein [Planotetraspora phitsanulokensis]GII39479.1 hypothetical protein Pph01_44820 [Planotetraspora phitsanulokensis]
MSNVRSTLLVIYSPDIDACRRFYADLGFDFQSEKHGTGPEHYASTFPDGAVFEIYPAKPGRETGALRLGFAVEGTAVRPPLAPGVHVLTDPDGRVVEVHAS